MMVEAGFDAVFIGIETPDEASLAECNKRQNKGRDMVAEVKRIQRAGLEVQGGFIVGFDSDTPSIFQRQIEFIQKSGIATAMVGLLNALPDTKLYKRLKREGRLIGDTSGDNVDGTTNFIPRMDMEKLREGYKEILRHIYAPGPYYQRVRTFLREYHPPKIEDLARLAEPAGVHPFQSSSGRLRQRTLPLLGTPVLDLLPSPSRAPNGRDPRHLRPPLPQDLRNYCGCNVSQDYSRRLCACAVTEVPRRFHTSSAA